MLSLLLLISLTAPPSDALLPQDDPGRDDARLREALHTWYGGERVGLVPFVGAGVSTSLAGTFLVTSNTDLGRSAGWTLIGFGALEAIAGLYLGLSTIGKEAAVDLMLTRDRAAFLEAERAHMARITKRMQPILLAVEGVVTAGGGVLAGVGALRRDDTMLGVGLGLAVQGLVLFLLDWAVLDRANAYASVLR